VTRVVFDTNVFVSAFEFGGVPGTALLLASTGLFEVCTSGPLLDELIRVLRDRFEYSGDKLKEIQVRLAQLCTVVETVEEITACSDPEDNRVLECAAAAKATCIVTGDNALLRLHSFHDIPILTPAQFLEEKPWATQEQE
jgi:putative PIN family toxin of toxin-antitoxin system